jgi:hypothetical protein
MTLDPDRVYNLLDELQTDVRSILVHQKEQNGNVKHNTACIKANTRLLEKHGELLVNHGERIGKLERGEEVEASWQREFRGDTKDELNWSRGQIVKLIWKVGPWVVVAGLLAERVFF